MQGRNWETLFFDLPYLPSQETPSSMTHSTVHVQIASENRPSTPAWFGEVAIVAQVLSSSGVLRKIEEEVRFARARFGIYELIDFVAVLIGYAVSTEASLQTFYERVQPFAPAFMALFGRQNLPHRSTLSRYLAALDQPVIEAVRVQFLDDLLVRTAQTFPPGGLWDREGKHWLVMDVDGTKQAARQRALPKLAELPAAHRRFERVCAPGYLGRKRGEVARTRTTVLQAHSHQWLGTFAGPGNESYRAELDCACQAIIRYAGELCMPLPHILIRLDGLYGTTAVLLSLLQSGMGVIGRWKDYGVLDLPAIAARLKEPADAQTIHPESGASRSLFDCPAVVLDATLPPVRLIIATHPTSSTSKPPVGTLRNGIVYEVFLSTAPQAALTCIDVLDLYLHRGSFETVLADEDAEQQTDRWCSHTTWGQQFWQIVNQWIWNLRLHLGQHLTSAALCWTEFAPVQEAVSPAQTTQEAVSPAQTTQYGPPRWAQPSFTKGFAGTDFVPQPDGTLRCPAGHPLSAHERRPERNGSLRVVYGARIVHCRSCPLRAQCLESPTTKKPRQVSAVFWPVQDASPSQASPALPSPPPSGGCNGSFQLAPEALPQAPHPVLWADWPRASFRRQWLSTLRTQTVELTEGSLAAAEVPSVSHPPIQTRAQRAHYRLSWLQRLARNARSTSAPALTITVYGLPASLAAVIGCGLLTAA
jgi:hypothetical protein